MHNREVVKRLNHPEGGYRARCRESMAKAKEGSTVYLQQLLQNVSPDGHRWQTGEESQLKHEFAQNTKKNALGRHRYEIILSFLPQHILKYKYLSNCC